MPNMTDDDTETTHHAMKSVLDDMGRAAREGRARRFQKSRKPVEVTLGEVTLEPHKANAADREVDPVLEDGMSHDEMDELQNELTVQR